MKNEVINLKGSWYVAFQGRVLRPSWPQKGPAQSCLRLLEAGRGTVTEAGNIKWNPEPQA